MAAINVASSRDGLSSPAALYFASFFLMRERGPIPSIDNIRESSILVGGVFKYSMILMSSCHPLKRDRAARDLEQRGL